MSLFTRIRKMKRFLNLGQRVIKSTQKAPPVGMAFDIKLSKPKID